MRRRISTNNTKEGKKTNTNKRSSIRRKKMHEEISKLQAALRAAEAKANVDREEIATRTANARELETVVASSASQIASLESDLAAANVSNARLADELSAACQNHEAMSCELERIKEQRDYLNREMETLEQNAVLLTTALEESKMSRSEGEEAWERELAAVKQENQSYSEHMNRQLEAARSNVEALSGALDSASDRLQRELASSKAE